jgi:hypothetical protein
MVKGPVDIGSEAVAKRVVRGCNAQFRALNSMLLDIEPMAKPKEFKAVKRVVGEVLGLTTLEVLFPLFERFPHLDKRSVLKGETSQ